MKQDIFKYCPSCGKIEINSDDGHRFMCKNCDFEYFHNTASAVAGIIVCGKEILLVTRNKEPAKGRLDLPGGFVDLNETLESALRREVKEELGIDINVWQYLISGFNTYQYNNIIYKTCDAVFFSLLKDKPKPQIDPVEISNFEWVNVESIDLNNLAFTSLRNAVKTFIDQELWRSSTL